MCEISIIIITRKISILWEIELHCYMHYACFISKNQESYYSNNKTNKLFFYNVNIVSTYFPRQTLFEC